MLNPGQSSQPRYFRTSGKRSDPVPKITSRLLLLLLFCLPPRSSEGHAGARDVPCGHVADQRGEGRPRKLLEAVRPQGHAGAPRVARGDALPQLRHHVQVPVSVHSLQEHVCPNKAHLSTQPIYRYRNMRLDIVLDFEYRHIVLCHKCCRFLVLKAALQWSDLKKKKKKENMQYFSLVKYLIHTGVYKKRLYHVVILYRLFIY